MKLNDYFVKARYQGSLEPCEVNGVVVSGFEIFSDVVDWGEHLIVKNDDKMIEPKKGAEVKWEEELCDAMTRPCTRLREATSAFLQGEFVQQRNLSRKARSGSVVPKKKPRNSGFCLV